MPRRQPCRILVVDDDIDNRDMLNEILCDAGYRVVTASNGKNAISLTEADRPDIVFVDLLMPSMDGRTVARELKSRHPSLPVVAMSGSIADTSAPTEFGVDATLAKPFSIDDLLVVVRRWCRRSAASI